MNEMFGTGPEMHRTEDHTLQASDSGGWVLQDIDGYDTLGRRLVEKSSCAVVLVDYRKAPEHPFPAAVEDSWTTLTWAGEHLEEIAGARVPLFVGGDSAGGNLSAVMALRARETGGPAIAKRVLVYPVTDADFTRPSYTEEENQTGLTTEFMSWHWDQYVPDIQQRRHPDAAPFHAEDLSGLPPALVITAAYAGKLREAGVEVHQRRWEGQMHGFFSMVNVLPASAEALDFVVESVAADLEGAGER